MQTIEAMIAKPGGAPPGAITAALARREQEVQLKQGAIASAQEARAAGAVGSPATNSTARN